MESSKETHKLKAKKKSEIDYCLDTLYLVILILN